MNICVFGAARDDLAPGFFALGEARESPDVPALKKIKDFPPDPVN